MAISPSRFPLSRRIVFGISVIFVVVLVIWIAAQRHSNEHVIDELGKLKAERARNTLTRLDQTGSSIISTDERLQDDARKEAVVAETSNPLFRRLASAGMRIQRVNREGKENLANAFILVSNSGILDHEQAMTVGVSEKGARQLNLLADANANLRAMGERMDLIARVELAKEGFTPQEQKGYAAVVVQKLHIDILLSQCALVDDFVVNARALLALFENTRTTRTSDTEHRPRFAQEEEVALYNTLQEKFRLFDAEYEALERRLVRLVQADVVKAK